MTLRYQIPCMKKHTGMEKVDNSNKTGETFFRRPNVNIESSAAERKIAWIEELFLHAINLAPAFHTTCMRMRTLFTNY